MLFIKKDDLKRAMLKTAPTIFAVVVAIALVGCGPMVGGAKPSFEGREFLTVDFQPGQTLRYKFVSSREITIALGAAQGASGSGRNATDTSSESMEMIISYTPIEIDPFGLTKIKATCESIRVTRSKGPHRDPVQNLSGETFVLAVGPTGKIEDYSDLDELIEEIGKQVFRSGTGGGRIKDPDMIGDFVATQLFLWDAVSSIKEPSKGVVVGDSWTSKLSIPTPMVMRKARDVTYTLDEVRQSEEGRLAVIKSSYQPAESAPNDWPIPYSGRFQVAGTFGFYGNYRVLGLKGEGEELFNIDAGRIRRYEQEYQFRLKASLLIPLTGVDPRITINQKLTMTLLDHKATKAQKHKEIIDKNLNALVSLRLRSGHALWLNSERRDAHDRT